MEDEVRPGSIHTRAYFTSIGLGLKWYNYEELKRIHDLRLTTTAVAYLPNRLVKPMAEDAEEMGRGHWRKLN
jgi:hypothetical protein